MEGQEAPDFELDSTLGRVKLSSFRGKKVVLYFFPRASTPGCTRELERFNELYEKFKQHNAEVLGVSVDSINAQKKFAQAHSAKFPLLSDPEKKVVLSYGVLSERGTSAQRVTFIIDESGKVVKVLRNLKKAEDHADQALEVITELAK
ncbi:peroxiredoxin [Sulfodiicoccus acidiphilus]|nr:peroxiredoxin [Sulfodiicoccus acidiphilus]